MAKARVKIAAEAEIEERTNSARSHAWKWLIEQGESDVFHFHVTAANGAKTITPDDAQTVAHVHMLVESMASAMMEFSFFPYPWE